jgi:hypothetical protein
VDLVRRIQDILLHPADTWPTIAAEPTDVGTLFRQYVLILAAIPAVAGFIGMTLIGVGFFGWHMQVPLLWGLSSAVLRYLLTLAMIYVLALIVDALARSFGGTPDRQKAFKLVAYAATAGLVGGVFSLIPALGVLALLASLYSIYLFYVGLPTLMGCPPEKAVGYTAVVAVLSIVAGLVIGGIVGAASVLSGGWAGAGWTMSGSSGDKPARMSFGSREGEVTIDTAKIEEAAKRMQAVAAAAQSRGAGTSGTQAAPAAAVEGAALPADTLKGFLPETLGGWQRESIEAIGEGNNAVSAASATYRQGERRLNLSVTDVGAGLGAAAAMWSALTIDRDADGEIERVYHDGARSLHEKYRKDGTGSAEYQVVLANGTMVAAEGEQVDLAGLKSAVGALDVARLEALQRPAAKP